MDQPENDPSATVEAAAVDPGYALAERVRGASFKVARRGYDRGEVDALLAWLADELRGTELAAAGVGGDPDAMRRELERVGESTAEILRAAEQTAREVRGSAQRDAESLVTSARAEADKLRAESEEFATTTKGQAEEETRKERLEASQHAEEIVRDAEARAESIVEDALQRRRVLAARVEQLAERRGSILAGLGRLSDELQALRASVAAAEPAPPELDDEAAVVGEEEEEEFDDVEPVGLADPDLDELDDEPLPGDATEVLDPYDEDVEDDADIEDDAEQDGDPEWPK
jgi:DivIVA domain-containing protein